MDTPISNQKPIIAMLVSPHKAGVFVGISTYTSIVPPYGECLNQEVIDITASTIDEIVTELSEFKRTHNVIDIQVEVKGIGSAIYELLKIDFPNVSKVFVTRSKGKI